MAYTFTEKKRIRKDFDAGNPGDRSAGIQIGCNKEWMDEISRRKRRFPDQFAKGKALPKPSGSSHWKCHNSSPLLHRVLPKKILDV